MSGIKDFKITDTTGYKVSDVPGDTLSGTVAQNKAVFDNLGELIIDQFNDALDYLYSQGIDSGLNNILQEAYPVGSIYISTSNTNPTTLFGGTWERIQDKFLLCAGSTYSAGATGGSADAIIPSHTHTITASSNSAGAHTHTVTGTAASAGSHSHYVKYKVEGAAGSSKRTGPFGGTSSGGTSVDSTTAGAHTHSVTGSAASNGAHSHTITATASTEGVPVTGKNMPPYLAVYVWKRTA